MRQCLGRLRLQWYLSCTALQLHCTRPVTLHFKPWITLESQVRCWLLQRVMSTPAHIKAAGCRPQRRRNLPKQVWARGGRFCRAALTDAGIYCSFRVRVPCNQSTARCCVLVDSADGRFGRSFAYIGEGVHAESYLETRGERDCVIRHGDDRVREMWRERQEMSQNLQESNRSQRRRSC